MPQNDATVSKVKLRQRISYRPEWISATRNWRKSKGLFTGQERLQGIAGAEMGRADGEATEATGAATGGLARRAAAGAASNEIQPSVLQVTGPSCLQKSKAIVVNRVKGSVQIADTMRIQVSFSHLEETQELRCN
jgi:hypothetical protein